MTSGFHSQEMADEVADLFAMYPFDGAETAVQQAIGACTMFAVSHVLLTTFSLWFLSLSLNDNTARDILCLGQRG